MVAFSQMIAQLGERLIEAEINPLFVLPEGQGVRAADGVAILKTRQLTSATDVSDDRPKLQPAAKKPGAMP